MGVDYDAALVIGWPLEEIKTSEEAEEIAGKLDMEYVTAGNAYSGHHRFYLTLDRSLLSMQEISNLPQIVHDTERDMRAAGIKFGPFRIDADLYVY